MKLELPRLFGRGAGASKARCAVGGAPLAGIPAAQSAFPPALTGGESPSVARAKVDWLTYTFLCDADVCHDVEHLDILRDLLGVPVEAVSCAGMLGYDNGVRYFVRIGSDDVNIARLDWGGNHHKGRGRFDLSGTGCSKLSDWHGMADFISRQAFYALTRVDLACDLFMGEYTVEDAVDWYQAGEFNAGGRNPRHSMPGDWLNPVHGRTFEVGRRTNGKMLRAYEKGRQLGDASSAWTRFEVEFRNIDRDLTLDMLTDRDSYFAGAYKCLQRVLEVVPLKVPTHQAEGEISLAALVDHARTAYGKLVHVMRLSMSSEDVIDALAINGIPVRLEKAAVGGFKASPSQQERNHEDDHRRL